MAYTFITTISSLNRLHQRKRLTLKSIKYGDIILILRNRYKRSKPAKYLRRASYWDNVDIKLIKKKLRFSKLDRYEIADRKVNQKLTIKFKGIIWTANPQSK